MLFLSNLNLKGRKIKVRIRETAELRNNEFLFSSCLCFYHGTMVRTGITCHKILSYIRDSACW